MSASERKAAQRAREHAAEVASARAWLLERLKAVGSTAVGRRVASEGLHAQAVDAIELRWGADELIPSEDGIGWRVPSRRAFYAVADHVLGARQRTARARFYVIPAEPNRDPYEEPRTVTERIADAVEVAAATIAERVADAAAAILSRRSRGEVPTFDEQRDYLAAFLARRRTTAPASDPTERHQHALD
ncbi:hypothetical protein [Agromyces sp. CCNWLW203]|uniref:hypothetical protein n=1 Tax=Agromyces sp. CCNWLW203 TaxID=3112842 RepID=UPI002F965EE5